MLRFVFCLAPQLLYLSCFPFNISAQDDLEELNKDIGDPTYRIVEEDSEQIAGIAARPDPTPTARITYVNPEPPSNVPRPVYSGNSREIMVPATIDLAERMGLAINAITEMMNPKCDLDVYWVMDLLDTPPRMALNWCGSVVRGKYFQMLPYLRNGSGSSQNLDREHRLMKLMLQQQGADGLVYYSAEGKPWAEIRGPIGGAGIFEVPKGKQIAILTWHNGRALGGFTAYAHKYPDSLWPERARRLADALKEFVVVEGDQAYLSSFIAEPGWETREPERKPQGFTAGTMCHTAQGLAQYNRLLGTDPEATELARKLMRYIMRNRKFFTKEGEFLPDLDDAPGIHFHGHAMSIVVALELALDTGDKELLSEAQTKFDYAVNVYSNPLVGYFPIWLNKEPTEWHKRVFGLVYPTESCALGDMVIGAVLLSRLGVDRWDLLDRWIRNQFAEAQLTSIEWLRNGITRREKPMVNLDLSTTIDVPKRAHGAFAGWSMANDWHHPTMPQSIQNCCTVNGARALYIAWKNILHENDGTLRVNLLLNRGSRWADIESHIPYTGRVDIRMKQDLDLVLRLPEWIEPGNERVTVDGKERVVTHDGRWVSVGPVRRDQVVTMTFAMPERTDNFHIQGVDYTAVFRGNTVVAIDPPGKFMPLYQRGHYRSGETHWKKVARFMPDKELTW